MLAKFDATANDAEDEELVEEGFPILVMYHAKTNERVVYQGAIKWTEETVYKINF